MPADERFRQPSKTHVREELAYERRIKRELQREADAFRKKIPAAFKDPTSGQRPRTILAEGDSWFRYIIGRAIPFYLDRDPRNQILNLAAPGDELRDMLSDEQRRRLARELRRGPSRNRKYDLFLFSGGGNDLLGEGRFYRWLNDYAPGMTARQALNKRAVNAVMDYLEAGYREVFAIRDQHSPATLIYLHSYDYAQPNGEGVCGRGPWIQPHLVARGFPARLHAPIVVELLRVFRRKLRRLVRETERCELIQTQGTLCADDWANEIHPKNRGFKALANRFSDKIAADFP